MAPVSLGGDSFGLTGALFLAILDGVSGNRTVGRPSLVTVVPYLDWRSRPTLTVAVGLAA